jgi:hypothetical protein
VSCRECEHVATRFFQEIEFKRSVDDDSQYYRDDECISKLFANLPAQYKIYGDV